MVKETNIMVVGDVHGEWGFLNDLINKHHPEIILQCGDFGYFPAFDEEYPKMNINNLKPQDTTIYWCDGNHEQHWTLLDRYNNRGPNQIIKGVYYMPRGETITLPDGRTVMFMGGADSIDKGQRMVGYDWFPEELISHANLDDALCHKDKVDIMVSHTCPGYFQIEEYKKWKEGRGLDLKGFRYTKNEDPSRSALDVLFETYSPPLWYFGHWHFWTGGKVKNTKWTCLDMLNHTGCWEWLPA